MKLRSIVLLSAVCTTLSATVLLADEPTTSLTQPAAAAAPSAPGDHEAAPGPHEAGEHYQPTYITVLPFVALLICIAVLPLIPFTSHWWHHNRNRLLLALLLAVPVILFYLFGHPGWYDHETHTIAARGLPTLGKMLSHAILAEYIPFMVLLFSLYVISGGIRLRGDLPAHPATNTTFLGVGALLASFIGTTGAAMLLIRPLLHTNAERKHVKHTVIFFIFLVCNVGGCLLPIGDPPLFLGYLRGVPFLWTFHLTAEWAIACGILLVVYYFWDLAAYRKEGPFEIRRDETHVEPLRLEGKRNLLLLLGIVLAVALLVPHKHFLGLAKIPAVPDFFREGVMLALVGVSLLITPGGVRKANKFTYAAIAEVAALFIGIFITMQPAIGILKVQGPALGLNQPWQFFWATGSLSSFLDNAPTYVVFFETANSLTTHAGPGIMQLLDGSFIRVDLLAALSLGAVFMGAMTYIGNGPNFMVKAIAEERGIRMPSFFGYMLYSIGILIPIFILLNFVFFVFHLV
ncbi:MAG: hypothetical protein BIFFINMI_02189 [Phycisphaerae bacterium]|nr:hypothetical protein [Phycisphaerae bacterium]